MKAMASIPLNTTSSRAFRWTNLTMFPHLRASLITWNIESQSTGRREKTENGQRSLVVNASVEIQQKKEDQRKESISTRSEWIPSSYSRPRWGAPFRLYFLGYSHAPARTKKNNFWKYRSRGEEVKRERTKRGLFGLPRADLERLDTAQESAPPWPVEERWSRIPLEESPERSSLFLRQISCPLIQAHPGSFGSLRE